MTQTAHGYDRRSFLRTTGAALAAGATVPMFAPATTAAQSTTGSTPPRFCKF